MLSGAGTSMVGCTRLPSGPDLLRRALEMLVTDARLVDQRDRVLEDEGISTLVPELVFQRFHDILHDLPSALYDPFRRARHNGVHALLADLASSGAFIATSNFDLGIERAADEKSLRLPDGLPLHLHGRADDPESLVHTIRAVGRGLTTEIGAYFHTGLVDRHLVVLGYSGNDHEIMEAIVKARPREITWLVRARDDWALTNIERWRSALPTVTVAVGDLAAVDRVEGGARTGSPTPGWLIPPPAPSSSLVELEVLLAVLLQLGRYAQATDAANLADELDGTRENLASIFALRSFSARRSGDLAGAVAAGKRALRLARGGKRALRARASTELALAYLDVEPAKIRVASQLLRRARDLLEQAQHDEQSGVVDALLASAEHNIGFAAESAGDYERALAHYRRALGMKKQIGDLPYQITSERDVALMLILLGREEESVPHRQRFIDLAKTYADPYELAYFDLALGQHLLRQGKSERAKLPLQRAAEAFEALGDRANVTKARRGIEATTRN
jgi:tetratricopeptide (TPR) repeat protein